MKITLPELSPDWRKIEDFFFPPGHRAATRFVYIPYTLSVLRSRSTMRDGTIWLHVSLAKRDLLPSWEEIKMVKNQFIGEDKEAIHVIPKTNEHVNCHRFCLHLWTSFGPLNIPNLLNLKNEEAL
jgi:hypothetical protein